MNKLINDIIKPKNGREQEICNDPEFIIGAMYGKPRSGHPEGAVIYHIQEVLANIDKFYADDEDYYRMRLIAIVHDTFKHKVDQTKPKSGDNHHGSIAKKFADSKFHDTNILQVIALHDEAYNAWQKGGRHGDWYQAKRRAEQLISDLNRLGSLNLYVKFYKCDNLTGNKSQDNYEWFVDLIK
jgi:hypothetical protein